MLRVSARLLSNAAQKVVIPPAINRGPTDLLEAIAVEVGKDPTAPHYAFIDDPATIPTTSAQKRSYYLAKELGRRAARQLCEEWPTLFAFDRDVPRADIFRPPKDPDPAHLDPTTENLQNLIEKRRGQDAAILYEKIRSEDKKVPVEIQKSLFNLLVYYNNENRPFTEDEEWHGLRVYGEPEKKTWIEGSIAELLYEALEKTPEIRAAMICGLCKFSAPNAYDKAIEILEEAKKESQQMPLDAYNYILSIAQFKEKEAVLKQIEAAGILPNAETFNILLQSNLKQKSPTNVQKILAEMKALHISPTLRTFDLVLRSLPLAQLESEADKDKPEQTEYKKIVITWLEEILDHLQRLEKIELTSVNDADFFLTAMRVCSSTGHLPIAQRVVDIYKNKQNTVKMPAFTQEQAFYQIYLDLFISSTADIDAVEKAYKEHVPNLVGLSKVFFYKMVDRLKAQPKWSLILRVIEDGVCARLLTDVRASAFMRSLLLNVDYDALSISERETFAILVKKMVDAWIEISRFTEEHTKRLQVKLQQNTIAEGALLLTRIGEDARALELLQLLLDEEATQGDHATVDPRSFVPLNALNELFDHALRNKDTDLAATVFEVMSRKLPRNQLHQLAARLVERCRLSEPQAKLIQGFVRLRPQ